MGSFARIPLSRPGLFGACLALLGACTPDARPTAHWPQHADDPAVAVKVGRQHEAAAQYAEALDQYLWALDNGIEIDSTFARGALVDAILSLGAKYPPAMDALRERQRLLRLRILSAAETLKPVDWSDLELFVQLGRKLGDEQTAMATYSAARVRLRPESELRRDLWIVIERQLVEARRYVEAADEHEVVLADVRFHIGIYKRITPENERAQPILREAIESAVRRAASHYEALLGAGDVKAAGLYADELIEFRPTGPTFSVLIKHALRAGASDAAAALRARAYTVIPESDRPLVDKAAGLEKGS